MYKPRSENDATAIAETRPDRPDGCRLALGVDLGTRCGYGYVYYPDGRRFEAADAEIRAGQWDLSLGSYDSGPVRFVRLRAMLGAVRPDIVFYEEPKYTPPAGFLTPAQLLGRAMPAAELLGALKATLVTWCEEAGVPCQGYPIGSIKKHVAGRGNAGKAEVIAAVNQVTRLRIPEENHESTGADNVADAVAVLLLGLSEYALA